PALRKKIRASRRIISVKEVQVRYETDVQSASMEGRAGMVSRTGLARPLRIGRSGMDALGDTGEWTGRASPEPAPAAEATPKRGYILFLEGTTPLPRRDVTDFLYQIVNTFIYEAEVLVYREERAAVAAVKGTMQEGIRTDSFSTGPLKEGMAVLVDPRGAYWVQHEKVYAANDVAKTWSPGIDYSPPGVDIDSVKRAATRRRILFSVLEGTVEFLDVGDPKTRGGDTYDVRRGDKRALDIDLLTGEDMSEDTRFMLKWK
ncbi:unnamed protein product, partial [marine sediment metagenome]